MGTTKLLVLIWLIPLLTIIGFIVVYNLTKLMSSKTIKIYIVSCILIAIANIISPHGLAVIYVDAVIMSALIAGLVVKYDNKYDNKDD